jgi:cell division protein FtsL
MARTPDTNTAIGFGLTPDVGTRPPLKKAVRPRHREMGWAVAMVSILLAGLLVIAWQHSQWTDLGYDVSRLERDRAEAEAQNRHLRLELETLRAPERIEMLATRDLHLVAPSPTQAVVLERVRQAAAPARTLVARR